MLLHTTLLHFRAMHIVSLLQDITLTFPECSAWSQSVLSFSLNLLFCEISLKSWIARQIVQDVMPIFLKR